MDRPIVRPWWREPKWAYAGIGASAVFALTALTSLSVPQRSLRADRDRLTIATVIEGEFHDFIPLRAQVVPRETVYLDALEGGRVDRVFVEPGDFVTVGQPIVQFSNTELELNVLDREARLIESLTQLQLYQTQLEQNRLANDTALANIEYEIVRLTRASQRRKRLAANGMVPQEESQALQDELEHMLRLKPLQGESNERQNALRIRQLPQIDAQLEKLQKDIEITRSKLDNLMVRAPVDGRMTAIDLKVGENRNRGERLGEITPDSGFKLIAAVDEYYLGRLHKGQSATVKIDERDWPLRVVRVYPQVRGGTFNVDLAFEGTPPEGLLPGQAVQGKFALETKSNATMLPTGPFLQHTGGDWIFVLAEDGETAYRRRIRLGRRNIEQLEVLSGLEPGERVITSDYSSYEKVERIDLR